MSGLVRYHGGIADSARWEGFVLRDDDIVISTPSKSGTTWTQMLVALLLFDGVPDEPVPVLSPWLDMHVRSAAETEALLAAQTHRRFIKTHAPLDGVPWSDDVTYITVGRDPRDTMVSTITHRQNQDREATDQRVVASVGRGAGDGAPDAWASATEPEEFMDLFLDLPFNADHTDGNLANVLHHLRVAWATRDRPNSVLLHYADLQRDVVAEMCLLRDVLGIDLPDERVAELAPLASIDSMRSRAADTAPEAHLGLWKDPATFFRGGRRGDGAAAMTDEQRARYERRCRELVDDEVFLAWVHGGRTAADPATA